MGQIYEAGQRLEEIGVGERGACAYTRWDQRDPQVVRLWQETRQWSLDGFNQIYSLLDIHFDRYYFNSQAEQPGKKMVLELIARGIASDERPEGAVVVKIDDLLGLKTEKYRVLVVLRSDGTALYATEDLALAIENSRLSRFGAVLLRGGCAPVAALSAGVQDARNSRISHGGTLPAHPL